MNREIKFRGKRIDNGEWVYGDLYQPNTNKPLFQYYGLIFIHSHSDSSMLQVIPETVGQFTGLLDKNGKQIYEGDIVRDRWNSYTPIYQNAIYMAYNAEKINDLYVSTQFNIIWRNGCEVIGNIHDNKELLND